MNRLLKSLWRGCLLVTLCVGSAQAHKGSDAYLSVQPLASTSTLVFDLSIALKDLDLLVPIDANADARITWGEVQAATPALLSLLRQTAQLKASDPPISNPAELAECTLPWRFDGLERRSDGAYVKLIAHANCPTSTALALRYTLLREVDTNHRLLVTGHLNGHDLLTTASPQQADAMVLRGTPDSLTASRRAPTESAARPSASGTGWRTLLGYLSLGLHHLLEGYDHLAFLLALVLPLRLWLGKGAGPTHAPNPAAEHGAWWALLRAVTAFTVGHSITLMLATFGYTEASPTWVEPVIAASIAITALLNIYPVRGLRTEWLALGFGMVHGFGFAGLLQEAAAPTGLLPWALAGFNLGVEAGQLLAVSGWVLLSQVLLRHVWYPRVVVRGGSLGLTAVAMFWFWQRVW